MTRLQTLHQPIQHQVHMWTQVYQELLRHEFLGNSSAHLAWLSPYSEFRNEMLRQRKELVYALDLEVKGLVLRHLEALAPV